MLQKGLAIGLTSVEQPNDSPNLPPYETLIGVSCENISYCIDSVQQETDCVYKISNPSVVLLDVPPEYLWIWISDVVLWGLLVTFLGFGCYSYWNRTQHHIVQIT